MGNRNDMTVTDGSGVRKHVYSYDAIYQITDVNYPSSMSYLATDTTFNYDAAGTTSFSYDSSGNLTHDGNFTYTYDPENRLTQVQKPNPPTQQLNSLAAYTKGGAAVWV